MYVRIANTEDPDQTASSELDHVTSSIKIQKSQKSF